jgi:hypothetical protein
VTGYCKVTVSAVDYYDNYATTITAASPGFTSAISSGTIVKHTPSIMLTPSSFSLGSPRDLGAQIMDAPPAGQTITFTKSPPNADKFNLSSLSCVVDGTGYCKVTVSAVDHLAAYSTTITAASPGFTSASSSGTIVQAVNCTVVCPLTLEVIQGSTKTYDVSVGGDVGCTLDNYNCSKLSGSDDISITKLDADTCQVTALNDARYGSAISHSEAGADTPCDTNINIKPLGWIETSPN